MYTVVRFSAGENCPDEELIKIGTRLNELVPRAFGGLDRAGKRFSVTVSRKDYWETNIDETLAFIRNVRALIDDAKNLGVAISIDALVEPEDFHGSVRLMCVLPPDLLVQFSEAGVTLALTIVNPA